MLKKSPVPACLSRWTCISVAIHLWHHICSHGCRPVPQTCTCIHIHINVCIRFEQSFRHASGRKSSGPDRMLRKCFSHKLTEVFWPVLLKTACLAAEAAGKCILHHISLGPLRHARKVQSMRSQCSSAARLEAAPLSDTCARVQCFISLRCMGFEQG